MKTHCYFISYDVLSCAQHVEAKQVANKLWNRYCNLTNKEKPGAEEKALKVKEEFDKILLGLEKCGCYRK